MQYEPKSKDVRAGNCCIRCHFKLTAVQILLFHKKERCMGSQITYQKVQKQYSIVPNDEFQEVEQKSTVNKITPLLPTTFTVLQPPATNTTAYQRLKPQMYRRSYSTQRDIDIESNSTAPWKRSHRMKRVGQSLALTSSHLPGGPVGACAMFVFFLCL